MGSDVRERDQLIVFGYVRELQKQRIIIHNVPVALRYVCFSYYHIDDCFHVGGKNQEISEDHKTVVHRKQNADALNTVYAKLAFDSMQPQRIEWRFQIMELTQRVEFGFVANHYNCLNTEFAFGWNSPYYLHASTGQFYKFDKFGSLNGWSSHFEIGNNEETQYAKGDEIIFVLDLFEKRILFRKTDGERAHEFVVLFRNIEVGKDVQYKLAATTGYDKMSELRLTDFSVQYIHEPLQLKIDTQVASDDEEADEYN